MMLNGARLKRCLLGEARVLQELSVPYRQGVEWEGQPTRRAGMLGTGTYGRLQKLGPRMQTGWGPGLELGLPACPATNLKLPSAGWRAQTTEHPAPRWYLRTFSGVALRPKRGSGRAG